ncbi:hypothetical protein ACFFKU_11560 [Kineococcus gynurae]|uniref:Uncharacterized protein n=1 Tax=Kineococcus gynurae TaxID=452979 RepID=A0ABV5LUH6_9ACTN
MEPLPVPAGPGSPAAAVTPAGASTELLVVSPDLSGPACGAGEDLRAGDVVAVVTSARHPLLPSVLAAVLGVNELLPAGPEVHRLLADLADRAAETGETVPLGLPPGIATFVDVALAPVGTVRVRGLVAPGGDPADAVALDTRYDELLRLTGGHPVELG